MTDLTIPQLFFRQAARYAQRPVFWVKRGGSYQSITWQQAQRTVESLATRLLGLGVNPGDRIAILSENRPEWAMADLAIQSAGAWTVPIYPSLPTPDVLMILKDAEPVVCIASALEQLKKFRLNRPQVPTIRLVIVMDAAAVEPQVEQTWEEDVRQGAALTRRSGHSLPQRI